MRFPLVAAAAFATLTLSVPATAQTGAEDARFRAAQDRFDREYDIYRQAVDRYVAARGGRGSYAPPAPVPAPNPGPGGYRTAPDPYAGGYDDDRDEGNYDPARDYRSGSNYQERTLSANERVYAGEDGRYYCKRSDGTTGLIVGGAAGGVLGNVIDGGHSRTVGTLLGAAAGALAGKALDQNSQVRCR